MALADVGESSGRGCRGNGALGMAKLGVVTAEVEGVAVGQWRGWGLGGCTLGWCGLLGAGRE